MHSNRGVRLSPRYVYLTRTFEAVRPDLYHRCARPHEQTVDERCAVQPDLCRNT